MNTIEDKITEVLDSHAQEFKAGHLDRVRQQLLQAFRESVERAKPKGYIPTIKDYEHGYKHGVQEFRQNLLKELGEEQLSKNNKEK